MVNTLFLYMYKLIEIWTTPQVHNDIFVILLFKQQDLSYKKTQT